LLNNILNGMLLKGSVDIWPLEISMN
jgi:hypothetical protein